MPELPDFHFLRPWWLLALVPLSAVALHWVRRPPRPNPWRGIVDEHLLSHLLSAPAGSVRPWPLLLLLAWLLGVLALAGPSFSRAPAHQFRPDTPPLVLALDLSRSMDAVDLSPSRLAVAREKLQGLMRRLPPRQLALVVYSLQAYSAMPLTEDRDLIGATLNALETALMPSQGSDAAAALALAYQLVENTGESRADVLLVTDGVGEQGVAAASDGPPAGIRISVYGLGTPEGGSIPLKGGGVLARQGRPVRPRLGDLSLRALARAGQGTYVRYTPGDTDIEHLIHALEVPLKAHGRTWVAQTETWKDQGPWLILLLLPLAALAFRRGWLAAVVLCIGLPPSQVEALDWQALWRNSDQRGLQALRRNDPAAAAQLFADPLWRGVAHYRNRDYAAALVAFSGLHHPLAHYNRGNALVKLGRPAEAGAAYERALELDPSLEDARTNLRLVRNTLAPPMEPRQIPPPIHSGKDDRGDPPATAPQVVEERLAIFRRDLRREPGATTDPRLGLNEKLGGGAIVGAEKGAADGIEGDSIGQGEAESSPEAQKPSRGDARAGTSPGAHAPRGQTASDEYLETPMAPVPAVDPDEASSPTGSPVVTEVARPSAPSGPPEEDPAPTGPVPPQTSGERSMPEGEAAEGVVEGLPAGTRERRQAVEQWLARIPEDPGELLRAKFLREHRRAGNHPADKPPW